MDYTSAEKNLKFKFYSVAKYMVFHIKYSRIKKSSTSMLAKLSWRRDRDSNPGTPKRGQRFSRPPRSTTPASLRLVSNGLRNFFTSISYRFRFAKIRTFLKLQKIISKIQKKISPSKLLYPIKHQGKKPM